jgi:hypothetical protein
LTLTSVLSPGFRTFTNAPLSTRFCLAEPVALTRENANVRFFVAPPFYSLGRHKIVTARAGTIHSGL